MKRLLLALLLISLLAAGCRSAEDPPPATVTVPPPTAVPSPTATPPASAPGALAASFLEAWSRGDYATMYGYLTPAAQTTLSGEQFAQRYQNALTTAGVITVSTRLQTALQEGDQAQVAFHLTLETALVGDLITDTVMALGFSEGRWGVAWDPGLIWPPLAPDRYFRMDYTTPVRANIYDREGLGLATEGTIVTVGVIPGQVQDEQALLSALSLVTTLSPEEIQARYQDAPHDWKVPIADISAEVSVVQNSLLSSIPGLYRDEKEGRTYPYGAAPHVVGWVSPVPAERLAEYRARGYRGDEWVGVTGLEAWGEEILGGRPGGSLVIVDGAGNQLSTVAESPVVPSRAIHTTIDREFQRQVQEILGGRQGAIVVLDAQSGAVRALASGPGFDPNIFTGSAGAVDRAQLLASPLRPLFNRATQGTYPSASVFKIVTLSAAVMDAGLEPESSTFYCPGYWEGLGPGFRKVCWKADGHGEISLKDSLTASCDVTFYDVGLALEEAGPDVLPRVSREFGFGTPTGLVGVREEAGLVPDPTWKVNNVGESWWVGDTVNLSIGQGYLLVTPLQIARMIAAVGNGGTLYRPYVVERVAGAADMPEQVTDPRVVGQLPLDAAYLADIQEALRGVTTLSIGTAAHRFAGLSISVAGKTGTAEIGGPESIPHSWFAAYAPADDPEIAIAVIAERAGEGSTVAAPLTRQVVEAYYGLERSPLPPQAEEGYQTPTPAPEATTTE